MSRMRGVWRAAGAIVVVGLLVGGCTGDEPEPVTTPSPVETVEPTPSPSPTRDLTKRPERPEAMDAPTSDGAIAAATYVLDLIAYSFAAGDTGPWRAITSESCQLCVGLAGDVEEMVAAGDTSTGAGFTVEKADASEIAPGRWFGVDMVVIQAESARYDSAGKLVGTDPGGTYQAAFALSWDGGWLVDELGFEEISTDTAGS